MIESNQNEIVTQAFHEYIKENYKRDIVKAMGIPVRYKTIQKDEIDYDSID